MTDTATGLPETAAPSAEYVAKMTGAVHGDPTPAQVPSTPAAPVVPEKFRAADGTLDTAKLLASYGELETKLSSGKPAEADPAAQEAAAEEAKPGAKIERKADEPGAATESAPLATALETVRTAFEGGELTDDHLKPLLDAGLPREMIDTYFAGLKAIESSIELAAHEAAGGKDNFEAMRSWAASALTDAELDDYNSRAADPKTAKQAVEWLAAKHSAANPAEGRVLEANSASGASAGDVFASQHEVTTAMADPQYKVDSAYRQRVAEKLQRSIRSGSIQRTAEYHSS
jgi:hypothetical protein